jgi:acyl-CoA synthetase (NDP forming)
MIGRLRLFPLLTGYRGAASLDVDALVDAIVAIAGFAVANSATIQSMEVNPILVLPRGQGAIALDAMISLT